MTKCERHDKELPCLMCVRLKARRAKRMAKITRKRNEIVARNRFKGMKKAHDNMKDKP